jgi:hypothetical protein
MRARGSLWAKQAHNLPTETFTRELNRIYQVEAGFPEGMQRSEIAFRRIGNYCADAGVRKDELVEELTDYNRTQPQACHFKFSDCEVDTSRTRFRPDLSRVIWIVSPKIPLNPADWPAFLFDHEHIRRLGTVNARTVFRLYTRQIIPLVPPDGHVGCGEPFLHQREVESFKWPE